MITNYFSTVVSKANDFTDCNNDDHEQQQENRVDKGKRRISDSHQDNTDTPDFSYTPNFLTSSEQMELIQHLEEILWSKVKYTNKYSQAITTPRHTFCFGTPQNCDECVKVEYKGCLFMTERIPEWLEEIKVNVEKRVGCSFNAVILNNYIDGNEYISWHKDDESFLKHNTVASLSLGASRTFQVRRNTEGITLNKKSKMTHDSPSSSKKGKFSKKSVILISGSLCVLSNGIEHHIPKETPTTFKGMKNRYNITFRCLKDFRVGEKMSGWGNYYYYNRGIEYQIKNSEEKSPPSKE